MKSGATLPTAGAARTAANNEREPSDARRTYNGGTCIKISLAVTHVRLHPTDVLHPIEITSRYYVSRIPQYGVSRNTAVLVVPYPAADVVHHRTYKAGTLGHPGNPTNTMVVHTYVWLHLFGTEVCQKRRLLIFALCWPWLEVKFAHVSPRATNMNTIDPYEAAKLLQN